MKPHPGIFPARLRSLAACLTAVWLVTGLPAWGQTISNPSFETDTPDGTAQHAFAFGPQFGNISQGLFPDGDIGSVHFMTNWTPRAGNQLGAPPAPDISGVTLLDNGTLALSVPAAPNHAYAVDFKNDLNEPFWTPLVALRASGPTLLITNDIAGLSRRFYRVVLLR